MKFDIAYLKSIQIPADPIIKNIVYAELFNLEQFHREGVLGNQVTLKLVKHYAGYGEAYLKKIKDFSRLFAIEKMRKVYPMDIHLNTFPFIDMSNRCEILSDIRSIASKVIKNESCLTFDMACLELLYFFTILVNREFNWVTVDFLSNSNKNHQYLIA
jgi:hypothetical protein